MAFQQNPSPGSGLSSNSGFQYTNSPFGDTTYTKVFVGDSLGKPKAKRYAAVSSGSVTFRELEAARRACSDPTPIIDSRRANSNLASLGRPRPPVPYSIISNLPGRLRPASPYAGGVQVTRGAYVGSFGYQSPLPYNYQQGLIYPSYGVRTTLIWLINTFRYMECLEQLTQLFIHLGKWVKLFLADMVIQLYRDMRAVANAVTTSPMATIQTPYPRGTAASVPAQPQFIVTTPQFMQGSGSDQTTG